MPDSFELSHTEIMGFWGGSMKRIKKKLLAVVISIYMIISCVPSFAAGQPSYGNVYTSVVGTYTKISKASVKNLLTLINNYRWEACAGGNVPDPRNKSRYLVAGDYVPIKWSGDLEEIAMIRAAEAALKQSHERPNGLFFNTCVSSTGVRTYCESLAWLQDLISVVEWIHRYEKSDWINSPGAITHYSMMIDPSNTYVGCADFYAPAFGKYQAMEYNHSSALDEQPREEGGSSVSVDIEIKATGISVSGIAETKPGDVHKLKTTVSLVGGMTDDDVHGGVVYESSDSSVVEVSSDGTVKSLSGGKATITARVGVFSSSFTIYVEENITRFYGKDRYLTSFAAADAEKALNGGAMFDSAVLASGVNYPDALAGSALAIKKNSPLLLVNDVYAAEAVSYIKKNVKAGSSIYILGGFAVVPEEIDTALVSEGFRPIRLYGDNRYVTNECVIREIGSLAGDLIVCSGYGYADSISASGSGIPILLVGESLTPEQKVLISEGSFRFYIAGGTGAVSESLADELRQYGSVERLSGANRYETSAMLAEKLCPAPKSVLLAYGLDFPDGLSGGPLAYMMGAPMMLTSNEAAHYASGYVRNHPSATSVAVMGGPSFISSATVIRIRDGV